MKYIRSFVLLFFTTAVLQAQQCVNITDCNAAPNFCDFSTNNNQLWNEPYWWDPVNQVSDLSETTVSITAQAEDTCANTALSAKYLLFLDLDNNGSTETVIKSWDPPSPGTVRYNNSGNLDYAGGDVRTFDERPVPLGAKYQFAIEMVTAGNTVTARLRWNTSNNPDIYRDVDLPLGNHKIQWSFFDDLGNSMVCEKQFTVKDCKNPVIVCKNGLSVNILPTQQITLWITDFIQYAEDNATPSSGLAYGIRKAGTGTGFPVDGQGNPLYSLTYNCNELGTQLIEVWARDASGNADFCQTYVLIQDNNDNCSGGGGTDETPAVVCLNGVSVSLQQNGTVLVPVTALLENAYDNETPFVNLDFAMRRSGAGAGFPVDGQGNPIGAVLMETADIGIVTLDIWARDEDGNADFCTTYILVQEYNGNSSTAPTIVCRNGITANIQPTGFVQLWTSDFLLYAEDDNTPSNQIVFGLRKIGTGTGFPLDGLGNPIQHVDFDCSELGTREVELWAMDLDGNASYCSTYSLIQDPNGNCPNSVVVNQIACVHRWCDNAAVANVHFNLSGNEDLSAPPSSDGCYFIDSLLSNLPNLPNYQLTPFLDDNDPLNGITILDLYRISKHILGLEPLSTFGIIAADVNKSGTVTSFDIVEEKKLLLGIYQSFPNNTDWRFVNAAFQFPNPNNPFQTSFPEYTNVPNTSIGSGGQSNFIAVKIGDVDCDGLPGVTGAPDDRQVRLLAVPDQILQPGETQEIPVSFAADGNWAAIQAGFRFDPAMLSIETGRRVLPGLEEDNFAAPYSGALNLAWFGNEPAPTAAGKPIFYLRITAHAPLRLSDALRLATPGARELPALAYDAQENASRLELAYRNTPESAGGELFQAQPNPTAHSTRIPLRLTAVTQVALKVTDVTGKTIWEQQQQLPAGEHRLEIPAEVLSENGVYFWQISAGALKGNGKVLRINK